MGRTDYRYVTSFLKKFHKPNLLGHLALKRQRMPIAYGYRKTSSAKVEVYPGDGRIAINSKCLLEYFPRLEDRQQVLYPLNLTHCIGKYDVIAHVSGGGSTGKVEVILTKYIHINKSVTGQAGAIRHGISRAMSFYPDVPFDLLVKDCLLSRDSRKVERKKPGQKKARKKFAW